MRAALEVRVRELVEDEVLGAQRESRLVVEVREGRRPHVRDAGRYPRDARGQRVEFGPALGLDPPEHRPDAALAQADGVLEQPPSLTCAGSAREVDGEPRSAAEVPQECLG